MKLFLNGLNIFFLFSNICFLLLLPAPILNFDLVLIYLDQVHILLLMKSMHLLEKLLVRFILLTLSQNIISHELFLDLLPVLIFLFLVFVYVVVSNYFDLICGQPSLFAFLLQNILEGL